VLPCHYLVAALSSYVSSVVSWGYGSMGMCLGCKDESISILMRPFLVHNKYIQASSASHSPHKHRH